MKITKSNKIVIILALAILIVIPLASSSELITSASVFVGTPDKPMNPQDVIASKGLIQMREHSMHKGFDIVEPSLFEKIKSWIPFAAPPSPKILDVVNATYNSTLGCPSCNNATNFTECTTRDSGDGGIIYSRNNISPAAEPNQPNTIDTCADGTAGTYRTDESGEELKVFTLENRSWIQGEDSVQVNWTVYCYNALSNAYVAYRNGTNASWQMLAGGDCSGGGIATFYFNFTLDNTTTDYHVLRGIVGYNNPSQFCDAGTYSDRDDLAFWVWGWPEQSYLVVPSDPEFKYFATFINGTLQENVSIGQKLSYDPGQPYNMTIGMNTDDTNVTSGVQYMNFTEVYFNDSTVFPTYYETSVILNGFVVDPSGLNFTNGSIYVDYAITQDYSKCQLWNNVTNECDGAWVDYIDNLTLGEPYTIPITPVDPAFSSGDRPIDIALAPINDTAFVVGWINSSSIGGQFKIMNTNGSEYLGSTVFDSTLDATSRVSIQAINETHFAVLWADGVDNDVRFSIYDTDGTLFTGPTPVNSTVGTNVDVSVAALNDRFGACYVNDISNDAEFKMYYNNGTEAVGEVTVDPTLRPETTLNNLIECSAISTERMSYVYFDDQQNDATLNMYRDVGTIVFGPQDLDTNVGENSQIASTSVNTDRLAAMWYDDTNDNIYISVINENSTVILSATEIESNAGTSSRVAMATVRPLNQTDEYFVASWINQSDGKIWGGVYDENGTEITAPWILAEKVGMVPYDIQGRQSYKDQEICPGTFVVGYGNDTTFDGEFLGYYYNGSSWDGSCDLEIPVINYVNGTPNPVAQNNNINLTANVTDDIEVDTVTVETEDGNFTMIKDGGDIWYYDYNVTNQSVGLHNFTVYANDTAGKNADKVQGNYSVIDGNIPVINWINDTPDPVRAGDPINFSANVTDDSAVGTVTLEIDGTTNYTMILQSGDIYYNDTLNTGPLSQGLHNYTVYANDTSGNNATPMSSNFTVYIDNDQDGFNVSVDCNDNNATQIPLINNSVNYIWESKEICSVLPGWGNYTNSTVVVNGSDLYVDFNGSTINGIVSPSVRGVDVSLQKNVTIENLVTLFDYGFGIFFNYTNNSIIRDVQIDNSQVPIEIRNSENPTLQSVYVPDSASASGITIYNSNGGYINDTELESTTGSNNGLRFQGNNSNWLIEQSTFYFMDGIRFQNGVNQHENITFNNCEFEDIDIYSIENINDLYINNSNFLTPSVDSNLFFGGTSTNVTINNSYFETDVTIESIDFIMVNSNITDVATSNGLLTVSGDNGYFYNNNFTGNDGSWTAEVTGFNSTFLDNYFAKLGRNGIRVADGNISFINNTIADFHEFKTDPPFFSSVTPKYYALYIDTDAENTTITGNNFTQNDWDIFLEEGSNNTHITYNIFNSTNSNIISQQQSGRAGIQITNASDSSFTTETYIAYNSFEANRDIIGGGKYTDCITSHKATGTIIEYNNFTWCNNGVHLNNDNQYATINNNNFTEMATQAVYVYQTDYNEVLNNTFANGSSEAIAVYQGEYNNLDWNNITDHALGIDLQDSNNNTIDYNNINNITSSPAVSLDPSNYNNITGNLITNITDDGIYLDDCDFNKIVNNTVFNSTQNGIWLFSGSDNNTVQDNLIYNISGDVISLATSDGNIIVGNNATDGGDDCLAVASSDNNQIYNNYFTFCDGAFSYGIGIITSEYNLIYNNWISNNTVNAWDSASAPFDNPNYWNTTQQTGPNILGGQDIGGNYYSNYTGYDTDGDGIGETDIPFEPQNGDISFDYLPLTNLTAGPPNVTILMPMPPNITVECNDTAGVNISANVTDEFAVDTVIAEVTFPNTTAYNYTMTNSTPDIYYYNFTSYDTLGFYAIRIFANNSFGLINKSETTGFFLNDSTPPVIENLTATPNPVERSEGLNLSANIYEDCVCTNITANVSVVGDTVTWPEQTYTPFQNGHYWTISFNTDVPPGVYNYTWNAVNCLNHTSSASSNFTIYFVNSSEVIENITTNITDELDDILVNVSINITEDITTSILNGSREFKGVTPAYMPDSESALTTFEIVDLAGNIVPQIVNTTNSVFEIRSSNFTQTIVNGSPSCTHTLCTIFWNMSNMSTGDYGIIYRIELEPNTTANLSSGTFYYSNYFRFDDFNQGAGWPMALIAMFLGIAFLAAFIVSRFGGAMHDLIKAVLIMFPMFLSLLAVNFARQIVQEFVADAGMLAIMNITYWGLLMITVTMFAYFMIFVVWSLLTNIVKNYYGNK